MGLKRIKNIELARSKKLLYIKNKTVEERLQAIEKMLGVR